MQDQEWRQPHGPSRRGRGEQEQQEEGDADKVEQDFEVEAPDPPGGVDQPGEHQRQDVEGQARAVRHGEGERPAGFGRLEHHAAEAR